MRRGLIVAALCVLWLIGDARSASAQGETVASGDALQAAIDAALPGESILLRPGVTYVGHFRLPARGGSDTRPITLRTGGADAVPAGVRITPDQAPKLAKLQSPDGAPVLATRPGARFWTVQLIEFLPNQEAASDIITLGDGSSAQNTLDGVPSDLVIDRVYIHGDASRGQKRGIALNSLRTTISNSYIADIKAVGQDSQAIAGWNGPGDYLIENNYLEAAGENVLFGGADPSVAGLTPTGIVIRRNTIAKPLVWKQSGQRWQVKNLLELKHARDVTIVRNVFERNWAQAQSGYAILITVRNQDGRCPWCQVENVLFESNIVRDVAAGIAITGTDYLQPSRRTQRIVIRNNLFDGLDSRQWGGDGYLLQMTDEPRDILVDHNTVIQGVSGGIAKIDGVVEDFTFTNNMTGHGEYGIIATSRAPGNSSIRASLPGATISANVIAGAQSDQYPPGNMFPTLEEWRQQLMDPSGHDFRLRSSSPWTKAGTDGRALGADLAADPQSSDKTGTAVPRDGVTAPRVPDTGRRRR